MATTTTPLEKDVQPVTRIITLTLEADDPRHLATAIHQAADAVLWRLRLIEVRDETANVLAEPIEVLNDIVKSLASASAALARDFDLTEQPL